MDKKDFDYMQVKGLVDHRPFVVPGQISWMQAQCDKVYLTFLATFPGVEGIPTTSMRDEEYEVMFPHEENFGIRKALFKVITLNFSHEACSNYFCNEQGIGAMVRFNGVARSVFVPFAAMLVLYAPSGVEFGKVLGYDTFAARSLVNYITPGMMEVMNLGEAMDTAGVPQEVKSDQPDPKPEPKPRPNHLKRVQ